MVLRIGFLGVCQVLTQLLNLAALVEVARRLGPEGFGTLQLGITVSSYALIAAEMGLLQQGIRAISRLRDPEDVRRYADGHLGLFLASSTLVAAVAAVLLVRMPFYAVAPGVFWLYLACLLVQLATIDWISTGLEDTKWTGIFWIVRSGLYAVLVFAGLETAGGVFGLSELYWVPIFYLVAFLVGNAVLLVAVRRLLRGRQVRPRWPGWDVARDRFREALPIGASAWGLRVLMSLDVLLLGWLLGTESAGIYAAASKIGVVVLVGSSVAWRVLLPRFSRQWQLGGDRFGALFGRTAGFAVVALAPIAVGGVLLGADLIAALYAPEYAAAGPLLRVLACAYPIQALGIFFGNGLVATDRERAYLPRVGIAALLLVALALWWVPGNPPHGSWVPSGTAGAAWAVLAASSVLCLFNGWTLRAALRGPFWRGVLVAATASLVMALTLFSLPGMVGMGDDSGRIAVSVPVGGAVYVLVAAALLQRTRWLRS